MATQSQALASQTYLPDDDKQQVAEVYSFLEAHSAARGTAVRPRYLLVGSEEHDQVEIPASIHSLLVQVVESLQAGRAVSVAPQSMTLTTQQAADLLGVSRPTVIRLIDSQQLQSEKIGNRRRLRLHDVLGYREKRRQDQYAALDRLASELDSDEDVHAELERAREARQAVAARRRTRRAEGREL